MIRVTTLALLLGLAGTSYAQSSQADIAAKLNDEGKELMYANKYAEASKKFQEAVARVPELKYFFNLCMSRFEEGKFGDALTACDAVTKGSPNAELRDKTEKLVGKINDEAKAQGIDAHPAGGGGGDPGPADPMGNPVNPDPNGNPPPNPNPNPNPPPNPNPNPNPNAAGQRYQPAVGRPPSGGGIFVAQQPDNKYTWTLGVDLFGVGGQIGQKDFYGNAGGGLRIKSDYLINPAARFGAQGYFQISHYGAGKGQTSVDTLDIFDVGAALYKHICLGSTPRLCITPLAGVQLALMSPAGQMDGAGSQVFNYAALGARGEVALAYAFGTRYEHVLQVMGGFNLYSKVLSGPSADEGLGSPEMIGLDKGGIAGYFGLGYTYRFNTPLGSSPFVTLE